MNFHNVSFVTSFGKLSQLPASDGIELVFAGRSNVGKSTLINKIFGRKSLARTSAVPGKTVTINFFRCENVIFADLPGYGYAKRSHAERESWRRLIDGYFDSGRNIGLVFLLVDMRHTPSALDLQMIEFLVDRELPFVLVLTKADKLSKAQRDERLLMLEDELSEWDGLSCIVFSSVTGEGVDELRSIIEEIGESDKLDGEDLTV